MLQLNGSLHFARPKPAPVNRARNDNDIMDEQPKIPTPAPVLMRELNYTYTPIAAFVIIEIGRAHV